MGDFQRKYSDEQLDAMAVAYLDTKYSAREIVELAKQGKLTRPDGTLLDPFEPAPSSVSTYGNRLKLNRAGKGRSGITDIPYRDAIDTLRTRLLVLVETELTRLEKHAKRNQPVPPDLMRQLARALREAAAVPGKHEPAPDSPSKGSDGTRSTDGTREGHGLTGALLKDHRAQTEGTAT